MGYSPHGCQELDMTEVMTTHTRWKECFPGGTSGKRTHLPMQETDVGSSPGLGGSTRGGHGNPLQYFCLENPLDRGVW